MQCSSLATVVGILVAAPVMAAPSFHSPIIDQQKTVVEGGTPDGKTRQVRSDHEGFVEAAWVFATIRRGNAPELTVTLQSPSGRVFDLSAIAAPGNRDYKVRGLLPDAVGEPASGLWSLTIIDPSAGRKSRLQSWGIALATTATAPPSGPRTVLDVEDNDDFENAQNIGSLTGSVSIGGHFEAIPFAADTDYYRFELPEGNRWRVNIEAEGLAGCPEVTLFQGVEAMGSLGSRDDPWFRPSACERTWTGLRPGVYHVMVDAFMSGYETEIQVSAIAPQCQTDADCDNGDACDGEELCDAYECRQGATLFCGDDNPCTRDRCEDGCINEPIEGLLSCGDGLTCQEGEDSVLCAPQDPTEPGAPTLEHEPNDDFDTAQRVALRPGETTSLFGWIAAGNRDYFALDITAATEGRQLELRAWTSGQGSDAGCDADTYMYYYEERIERGQNDDGGAGPCSQIRLEVGPGPQHIAVRAYSDRLAFGYGLHLELVESARSCERDEECRDVNACNGVGRCDAGTCVVDPAPACDDQDPCTIDSCVLACLHEPMAAGAACGDSMACQAGDAGMVCVPTLIEEEEPNSTIETAQDIGTLRADQSLTVHGRTDSRGQEDFYRFEIGEAPFGLEVRTNNQGDASTCSADTVVTLYQGDTQIRSDDDGGVDRCSLIAMTATSSGAYLVAVRNYGEAAPAAAYELTIGNIAAEEDRACNGADLESDPRNCGACGTVCGGGNDIAACVGGTCVLLQCDSGFADCDAEASNGCETDLNTSTQHCGACGNACAAANGGSVCAGGECVIDRCDPGFADCNGIASDGCETASPRGSCD